MVLLASGLPEELVRVLVDLHTDTSCRIRVGGSRSAPFSMHSGVQQGCPLAPFLFNLFMDWVAREALAACPGSGVSLRYGFPKDGAVGWAEAASAASGPDSRTMQLPMLMLADDIAVLASSAEGLRSFLLALEAACLRWGLIISPDKTELMLVGGAAATACEGCQLLQPEGTMVLCDSCEAGWHIGCMPPPLPAVPQGAWLCDACQAVAATAAGSSSAQTADPSNNPAAAAPLPLTSQWPAAAAVGGDRTLPLAAKFSPGPHSSSTSARRLLIAVVWMLRSANALAWQ